MFTWFSKIEALELKKQEKQIKNMGPLLLALFLVVSAVSADEGLCFFFIHLLPLNVYLRF